MASTITVTQRRRPAVQVVRARRPIISAVTVPGPQGATGATGDPGPVGSYGLGQITYTERVIEASDFFEAGVRGQILFEPTSISDDLNPPFVGHAFWVANKVVPRAMGDLYDIQVNLIVMAAISGGQLRVDADAGSPLGPITSDTQTLFNGAQVPERATFRLRVQVLVNFMANGCGLFLTSSVPVTVASETVLVAPASVRSGR